MSEQSGNHHEQTMPSQGKGTLTSTKSPLKPDMQTTQGAPLTQQAKDVVGSAAQQAKQIVSAQATEQAGKSATDIGNVANALHQTSRELEGNLAAPYVDKAANQLDRVSQFLRTNDVGEIVKTVELYARREPFVFLGGALALGIIGGRFLKASGHRSDTNAPKETAMSDAGSSNSTAGGRT